MSTPWLLRIDGADLAWLAGHLSEDERRVAARIRSPRRRAEHTASRVLVKFACADAQRARATLAGGWRFVESSELRRSSATVDLSGYAVVESEARSQPPILHDVGTGRYECGLSISHKWPFVAVGYARTRSCGVDVERCGAVGSAAEDYYVPEAQAVGAVLPPLTRAERSTLSWTIKEAAFKALRLAPGKGSLHDVGLSDLTFTRASSDGTRFVLGATVRGAGRTARAQIHSAWFGRTVCSEVVL